MKRTLPVVLAVLVAVVGLVWFGSSRSTGGSRYELPPPVDEPKGETLMLGLDVPFASLEIPDESRDGVEPPAQIPLSGWKKAGRNGRGMHRFEIPVPFRPRGMFFTRAQPGMEVLDNAGRALLYQKGGQSNQPFWWHDTETLSLLLPADGEPPRLKLAYPRATQRERKLNWKTAHEDDEALTREEFVRGTAVTEGWVSREGLLLPAPAKATWEVTLPEAPVLTMVPGLVRPEIGELGTSDGCSLSVTITADGASEVVYEAQLQPGEYRHERVDLSKWAGRPVTLAMSTAPGASALYDYCFVGEPIIAPRRTNPRKVVLVFVDTLRPDHLSLNGYDRDTTPNLDRFAKGAMVFDNARSIAPWTLPSARTIVTGRQPELYDTSVTLQARLAEAGFANGMIAGNVYLSANFGMDRDWDHHEVGMFPPADQVTDSAVQWLQDHEGQDALLLVHYMSAHLPYQEPLSYRSMWAGVGPPGLQGGFHLTAVRQAGLHADPDGQQYVRDRYDQCVRWIDDELERLYGQIDDNDILVFFSDHGEEFWDHGGYEHGHTLYDELLRVPFVLKGPGIPAGRSDAPVSLLDLTPTVLDLLGLPPIPDADGKSLVALAKGDAAARTAFGSRKQAFGRPLYGFERWGVLDGTTKWTTSEGNEELYDLAADPGEEDSLVEARRDELPRWRSALGEALGRPSGAGFRITPTRGASRSQSLTVRAHVPGGIEDAWKGEDPLQRSAVTVRRVDDETVDFTWIGGYGGTREVYVLPKLPLEQVTHEMALTVAQGSRTCRLQVPRNLAAEPGRVRRVLAQAKVPGGMVRLGWSMAPGFPKDGAYLDATDDEMSSWQEALGYAHRDDEPEPEPVAPEPSGDLSDVEPCGG
ncbi:MAG: sulfatase [Alphaproteobacteria bacterium]|nr:sulfatase [Alphaproteobacteria bacterium]